MKVLKLLLLFLFINFGGLAIGNFLMTNGPQSQWYLNLNKAPWTPDGWVFGVAWTTIMLCFSLYLSFLFKTYNSKFLKSYFLILFFLNVIWNYIFFNLHLTFWAFVIITILTLMLSYLFFRYRIDEMKKARYLLLPYLIWITLATSLNLYVVLYN